MKKTLVFGASLKPNRYSNLAINRLVNAEVETFGFGLRQGEVAGVQIKTDLDEFKDIHTVTLYLNPERQKAYFQDIVDLAPKRVIFNPGTENPDFYSILESNGIEVDISCTLVLLGTNQF